MMDVVDEEDPSLQAWDTCIVLLPDSVILNVFSYLKVKDLQNAGATCSQWYRVSCDEFLWKYLLRKDWNISSNIAIAPGKTSWKSEYKRLAYHAPIILSEDIKEHNHQVLHVSFSHDGRKFATSSKDCHIKVWCSSYPASVLHDADMTKFRWNYTQYSQFNSSDTLLLVSGVHFGAHSTSGEIAVFNLIDGFTLQCRVPNKPYDTFGTWYNDNYLIAGNLHFLRHLESCSTLWLNKAWQESDSERKPVLKKLYKFHNQSASSIRTMMISKCLLPQVDTKPETPKDPPTEVKGEDPKMMKGNPWSQRTMMNAPAASSSNNKENIPAVFDSAPRNDDDEDDDDDSDDDSGDDKVDEVDANCSIPSPEPTVNDNSCIHYSNEYRQAEESRQIAIDIESDDSSDDEYSDSDEYDHTVTYYLPTNKSDNNLSDESDNHGDGILDHDVKLLIFTTGTNTYTPHQIGFKIVKPFKFEEEVKETLSLSKRLVEHASAQNYHLNVENPESIERLFDSVDHLIDLSGHIIGMGLSPDQRYLYVNSRPWPQNSAIVNPLSPPPIAQEIDIHVIDLMKLKEVGTMLRSHKAYTPNNECFFIFLDVSNQYVGSGAEDNHGYLWDRHYGVLLSKYEHGNVVNSVAFNPKDPEVIITASDDFTIKIWRSKNRIKQIATTLNVKN